MTQGFTFLLVLGGVGCGESAGCVEGTGPGFRQALFYLHIRMKIKKFNSIKASES